MKKLSPSKTAVIFVFALCLQLITINLLAQAPESFSYQAVVRDASGLIIANQAVSFRISILQESASGTEVYAETHAYTTDAFGLANLKIGQGSPIIGTFSTIDWGNNTHFIKVAFDPDGGSNFMVMGTSQLLSVPYAIHARTVEIDEVMDDDADATNELQSLSVSGNNLTISQGNTVSLPNGGNTLWIPNGDNISYSSGNVGIGTDTPYAKLAVVDLGSDNYDAIYGETDSHEARAVFGLASSTSGDTYGGYFKSYSSDGTGVYGLVTSTSGTGNTHGGYFVSLGSLGIGAFGGAKYIGLKGLAYPGSGLTYGGWFEASSNESRAVYGYASSTNGFTYGGYFEAASADGTAVYGLASSLTNSITKGGFFESNSYSGIGVRGYASATSGITYGGSFETASDEGRAVYGYASSTSGPTYGGKFEVASADGTAVYGLATSTSNSITHGGYFRSTSPYGIGVLGEASTTTGVAYGGYFVSSSNSGKGVYGYAHSTSGDTYGGYFKSNSSTGRGVYAEAPAYGIRAISTASSGDAFGGYFVSSSSVGRGVYAEAPAYGIRAIATATSGYTFGGYFVSSSSLGTGVCGYASSTSGVNYGGYFESASSDGRAVYGFASSTNGANCGGYFLSSSPYGLGVYAEAGFFGIIAKSTTTDGYSYGGKFIAESSDGTGAYAAGGQYDFYAGGPGINYGSASSKRWKKNVLTIAQPLQKVSSLRGVYFVWDSEHGGQNDIGFIAEEVGEVLPEIVAYEENGIDAMGMDYSKLSPLLVEAIKALIKENEILHAENKEIISRLDQLEALLRTSTTK
jgi:hypothetical protein